jgi:formate/nitrite transporter FocA (FNT family)
VAAIMPVSAFVALGGEHCIANMLLIPAGILSGANVSWINFFVRNLLPCTLGNICGGAILQTVAYSSVYGSLGAPKQVARK